MFNIRCLVLTLFTLTALTAVHAQITFNSIEEAWQYADKHNLQIQTSVLNERIQTDSKRQALSNLLPQASATGQYTDNWGLPTTLLPAELIGGKHGTYIPIKFGQQYVFNGALTAQMDVINVSNWFNVKMAEANAQLARAQTGQNKKTVYEQVASQFYGLALSEKAAELARISFNLADSLYQSSYEKFKNGLISDPALNSTLINQLKSAQNMGDAEMLAREQRNNFKLLLNLASADSVILHDAWNMKDTGAGLFKTFAQHPAINVALFQNAAALQGLDMAKAQLLPTLSLFANLGTQQNNNDFKPLSKDVTWYQTKYWGVKLNVPLFTGGSRIWQWQKSKAQLDQAALQHDYAKKQADIEDKNLLLDYAKYHTDAEQSDKILKLYLNIFKHKKQQYVEGLASLDDVSLALSDYINYQNIYLNTLSNYYLTVYKIKIRQIAF